MVMIKSTSMNLVNVLVRFNQPLWYFCSFPHNQYRHPPSHLPSQEKKISGFKSLMIFSLSCNYNNYMTCNWPNSAFFIFSKECKSRELQTIFVHSLFYWQIGTKNLTKREFIVEPSFFTSWTIRSEKCARVHVQQNKTIYLYTSLYENVFENGCTYTVYKTILYSI